MSPRIRSRVRDARSNPVGFNYSEATAEQIDQEVRKLQDQAYRLARTTLMVNRDKLERIANSSLDYETSDSSQTEESAAHDRLTDPPAPETSPSGTKISAENPLGSLGLTAREAEVLTWVAQGKSNYEIGVILRACTGTICKHVEHILAKLNVENRTAAAVVAIAALASAKK